MIQKTQLAEQKLQHERTPSKDISKFTFSFSDSDGEAEVEKDDEIVAEKPVYKCESIGKLERRRKSSSKKDEEDDSISEHFDENPENHEIRLEKTQSMKSPVDDDIQYEQVIRLQMSDVLARRRSLKYSKPPKFFDIDEPAPPKTQQNINIFEKLSQAEESPQKSQQSQHNMKTETKCIPVQKNSLKTSSRFKHQFLIYQTDQNEKQEEPKKYDTIVSGIKYLGQRQRQYSNNDYYSNARFENPEDVEENMSENLDEVVTSYEENVINIFKPSEQIEQNSIKISEKICRMTDPQKIKMYLFQPIPEGVLLEFEVHKYKYFNKTLYLLWTKYGSRMRLHAIAKNSSFALDKTIFDIILSTDGNPGSDEKTVIGKLVSDFKRETFSLYSSWKNNHPDSHSKIFCTVVQQPSFFGIQTQDLYTPKLLNKQYLTINCTKVGNNLKKLSKLSEIAPQITRFRTHKVPEKQLKRLKQTNSLKTNTTRNGLIKDLNERNIFCITKMQGDRFRVVAANPVSPLQILSYCVVHLE